MEGKGHALAKCMKGGAGDFDDIGSNDKGSCRQVRSSQIQYLSKSTKKTTKTETAMLSIRELNRIYKKTICANNSENH